MDDNGQIKPTSMASLEVLERFYPRRLLFSEDKLSSGAREPAAEEYIIRKDVNGYFPNFPVLISGDGNPWRLGNLYLTQLAFNQSLNSYRFTTHRSKALHLLDYLRFLERESLDCAVFPVSERRRPTYRYRLELIDRASDGELAFSTAKARIGTVVQFYRSLVSWGLLSSHLISEGIVFKEVERTLSMINGQGFMTGTKIRSTDLHIKTARSSTDPDVIMDGGRLKPLPPNEQQILFEALKSHSRCFQLMFIVALYTGARLQTVCTLRIKHLYQSRVNNYGYACIAYGGGSEIDGKGDIEGVIRIPNWVINALKTYLKCEVAVNRRKLSYYGDTEDNYVFLTRNGTPYYTSRREANERRDIDADKRIHNKSANKGYKYKTGEAVQVFIRQELLPSIKKTTPYFPNFTFHDLRATFGMNLIDKYYIAIDRANKKLMSDGKPLIGYSHALDEVQVWMNHRDRTTTEHYLKFRDRSKWKRELIDKYEITLLGEFDVSEGEALEVVSDQIAKMINGL